MRLKSEAGGEVCPGGVAAVHEARGGEHRVLCLQFLTLCSCYVLIPQVRDGRFDDVPDTNAGVWRLEEVACGESGLTVGGVPMLAGQRWFVRLPTARRRRRSTWKSRTP